MFLRKLQLYRIYSVVDEGSRVTVTTYKDPGTRSMEEKPLGSVSTPTGEVVTKTSAYARVDFV